MNTSTLAVVVVVIIIILGGGWWFISSQAPAGAPSTSVVVNSNPNGPDYSPSSSSSSSSTTQSSSSTTVNVTTTGSSSASGTVGASAPTKATITLTSNGFSPKSVTIKKGGTITWVNQSGSGMWVASANHPTHTVYSGTTLQQHCPDTAGSAFDQCTTGNNYTFTFQKTGSWNFHNHVNASEFGTVNVVE